MAQSLKKWESKLIVGNDLFKETEIGSTVAF